MTRIAMVVLSFYPNDPRVRREAEILEKNGIFSDIICMRGPGEARVESIGDITVYRVIKGRAKESIVRYLMLTAWFMLASFFVLAYLSAKKGYRLIQFHNMPDFLVFTAFIQKLAGIPVILDFHDLSVELFETKWGQDTSFLISLVRLMERVSAAFSDRLITTSEGFRDRLIGRGIPEEKITLVLNSADHAIFHFNDERVFAPIKDDLHLIYHGTVTKRFGLDIAIDAIALLTADYPGVVLSIYGKYDDSFYDMLHEMIRARHLEKHVILGGYLSLEDVYLKIIDADIGLVPYRKDPFTSIALSTKTFEYVESGLPVVSSRLASIEAIFPDDCLEYFTPGDAADLARAIRLVSADPERRARLVRAARAVYRHYSWESMGGRYVDLVRGALDHARTRRRPAPKLSGAAKIAHESSPRLSK